MAKRKVWVEPLFGEAKDWHGLRRFRLRRLWKVNAEALLIATGQNLKRLLRKRGWGRRLWPNGTRRPLWRVAPGRAYSVGVSHSPEDRTIAIPAQSRDRRLIASAGFFNG